MADTDKSPLLTDEQVAKLEGKLANVGYGYDTADLIRFYPKDVRVLLADRTERVKIIDGLRRLVDNQEARAKVARTFVDDLWGALGFDSSDEPDLRAIVLECKLLRSRLADAEAAKAQRSAPSTVEVDRPNRQQEIKDEEIAQDGQQEILR